MRYVMFMIPAVYGDDPVDTVPPVEMVEKMMAYNARLSAAGVLVSLDGLHPPAEGVRLAFGEGGPATAEVPAVGAVGGYWVLDVDGHEAALDWAQQVPALPGDVIELRRVQDMADFPDELQEVVDRYDI